MMRLASASFLAVPASRLHARRLRGRRGGRCNARENGSFPYHHLRPGIEKPVFCPKATPQKCRRLQCARKWSSSVSPSTPEGQAKQCVAPWACRYYRTVLVFNDTTRPFLHFAHQSFLPHRLLTQYRNSSNRSLQRAPKSHLHGSSTFRQLLPWIPSSSAAEWRQAAPASAHP